MLCQAQGQRETYRDNAIDNKSRPSQLMQEKNGRNSWGPQGLPHGRAKTISLPYLSINLGIYDQKVQIWRGVKKDKWA